MVEPVVVGAVGLRVVGWGQDGHLVAVDRVATEEMLHLQRTMCAIEQILPFRKFSSP